MFKTKLAALALVSLGAVGAAEAQSVHLSYGIESSHGALTVALGAPRTVPRQVWVPGRYEELERRVWVEGGERTEWVPARYETRLDECGRPTSVLVRAGHWQTVRDAGHFELRTVRVWVEGFWRTELVACEVEPSYRSHRATTYSGRPAVHHGARFDGFRYDGRR
jgi:hypothetical protein